MWTDSWARRQAVPSTGTRGRGWCELQSQHSAESLTGAFSDKGRLYTSEHLKPAKETRGHRRQETLRVRAEWVVPTHFDTSRDRYRYKWLNLFGRNSHNRFYSDILSTNEENTPLVHPSQELFSVLRTDTFLSRSIAVLLGHNKCYSRAVSSFKLLTKMRTCDITFVSYNVSIICILGAKQLRAWATSQKDGKGRWQRQVEERRLALYHFPSLPVQQLAGQKRVFCKSQPSSEISCDKYEQHHSLCPSFRPIISSSHALVSSCVSNFTVKRLTAPKVERPCCHLSHVSPVGSSTNEKQSLQPYIRGCGTVYNGSQQNESDKMLVSQLGQAYASTASARKFCCCENKDWRMRI